MAFTLFEDRSHFDLLPLTYTRPVFALRMGIFTFQERWERYLSQPINGIGYDYLQVRYPLPPLSTESYWLNGKVFPDEELGKMIKELEPRTAFLAEDGTLLMARFESFLLSSPFSGLLTTDLMEELGIKTIQTQHQPMMVRFPEDIFQQNGKALRDDFSLLTQTENGVSITDPHSRIYGADNIFVHPSAKVRAAILNAEDGPIYLGPKSEIMEGAVVRGAHAIGENARINIGAKLRGDTTIGPSCKVGGEVANSVIQGCSNKGHEGYLGNSVLGSWCNLGADTNTSNLKNNYAPVRIWHYPTERFRSTGTQFCGLIMGDHSKCGINTMFNTGTVVGVSANIFGAGYPRNFIPSFSWGGAKGMITYRMNKVLETAAMVMPRKGGILDEAEKRILGHIFEETANFRVWDKKSVAKS